MTDRLGDVITKQGESHNLSRMFWLFLLSPASLLAGFIAKGPFAFMVRLGVGDPHLLTNWFIIRVHLPLGKTIAAHNCTLKDSGTQQQQDREH